ncbi:MAG: hypothetical protein ACPGID_09630 [Rubricella sp.]
MFTIEHEFDGSVITLVDESGRGADVTITVFDDSAVLEQVDPHTERGHRVVLTMDQLRELGMALDLPEGSYRLNRS